MNKKKILKLTAAAMAITSAITSNYGQSVQATESREGITDEILSEVDENKEESNENKIIEKSGVTTGAAASVKDNKMLFENEKYNTDESAAIYKNDFESDELPNQFNWGEVTSDKCAIEDLGTNKVLKFSYSREKTELAFEITSAEKLPSGSKVQFDILIPDSAQFDGEINYGAGLSDDSWNWVGADGDLVKYTDFTDEGNGYLKKTVYAETSSMCDGVKRITVQLLDSENCTYIDDIYIDNLKLIKGEEQNGDVVLPAVEPIAWSFDNSAEGWAYGGTWAYKGSEDGGKAEDVSQDADMQALKVNLDYSNEGENSWSEYKLQNDLDESIDLNGYNVLTYDFIYDPAVYKNGSFKAKLFMKDTENEKQKVESYTAIDLNNAEKFENGLKKAKVTLEFENRDINIQGITLGIIGSNTTYKGNIYIDNITLDQVAAKEVYIEKTAVPNNDQPKVTADKLEIPASVKLVDSNVINAAGQLYGYLMGLGKTDKVIYGHQNDTHRKAVYTEGSESDTKDITGSISGIVGIDTLSLTGDELTDEQKADGMSYVEKSAEIGRKTVEEGGILTLSAHMPNFAVVKEKGKGADGRYDYTNYSASTTSGDVVNKILPGGELNDVYTGYLDLIAEYAHELSDTPILFRPLHENNGSWFWWGGAFCDSQTYKSLYAYTVEYLRDEKDVHNFLYVYSPNGPFKNADDYLSRYPGDEFVDVVAFDMYHDNPSTDAENDPWFESLRETVKLVEDVADERGKLSAASELGVKENGGGLSLSGNANKQWFKIVSDIISESDMPYYMTWANFNTSDNFFAPFMVDENKGHEMINDFIDYYNDEKSVFAKQIGDYTEARTTIGEAYSYGYIVSPVSRTRIIEPATIKAKVKNIEGNVKFIIKNKEGKVLNIIQGIQESDEVWTGEITKEILNSIGEVNGTIELQSGDTTLNYIKALFNMKEAEKQPRVVDDFEGYMGDDSLLSGEWASNVGPGCSVTPGLSANNKKNGEFGLTFEYKISTEKTSEGYAGITKSVGSDWSGADALQFWINPDGYGQKLILQITSNGEEFEVNLKDIASTTEPQLVTVDFNKFKGKKGGKLDLTNIEKFGIYCNTIVPDDHEGSWTVDSKMYFDDIKAVNTKEISSTGGGSSSSGGGSSSSSSSDKNDSQSSEDNTANTETNINNTGWILEDGKWYYVQEDGIKKTGWLKDTNGEWYYLDIKGEMKTGWIKDIYGKWYYMKDNGTMHTGWLKDTDGEWYYLELNGEMKTGWLKDSYSKWYYMKDNGAMHTGWMQDNSGAWYYLEANGEMKTGWLKDSDGKWYYLESNGTMKVGWFKDTNGNWYYLDQSGAMLSNTVVDGYVLSKNGVWIR